MKSKMYTFTNCNLSSLQKGLQAAHSGIELLVKYAPKNTNNVEQQKIINEWVKNGKSIIILNGGDNTQMLQNLWIISKSVHPYAVIKKDLSNTHAIIKSISVILPETIYSASAEVDKETNNIVFVSKIKNQYGNIINNYFMQDSTYYDIITLLHACELA